MVKTVYKQFKPASVRFIVLILLCLSFAGFYSAPSAQAAPHDSGPGGVTWPQDQTLPTFNQPRALDVVDLRQVSTDEALTFSTLEGIVNRREPRIYLLQPNPDEGYFTWLNDMKIPYVVHANPWEVLTKYLHEVRGVIIYDPNLLDSSNVAVTMAGLQDGLVVSPDLAAKLEAAPYSLPVLADLRGKFGNALEAYTWEFQNLWPQTTHRMLVGIPAGQSVPIPADNWKNFQTVQQVAKPITDGSNRAVYNLDLSSYLGGQAIYLRFQDAYPQDGWGPSVHQVTVKADGNVVDQFTGCTAQEEQHIFDHGGSYCLTDPSNPHRFADGSAYFVYRFVPPAGTKQFVVSVDMWNEFLVSASSSAPQVSSDQQMPIGALLRDYAVANRAMVFWLHTDNAQETALFTQILSAVQPGTPYLGWFDNETSGVSLASQHAVTVLATDYAHNLTVFSGMRAPIGWPRNVAAPPLQNKVYVTLTVSDGDNIQYDQHRMRLLWDNAARGSVPINWSIDPLVADYAPLILSHYQRTATNNDMLIAAPSGDGYFYPSMWPQSNLDAYMRRTGRDMQRTGMNVLYALDQVEPIPAAVAKAYNSEVHLQGLFYNWGGSSNTTFTDGTLPTSFQLGVSDKVGGVQAIHQLAANWDGKEPLFISVLLDAWHTTPADAQYIAQNLGANYSVVRADQYFQLFRESSTAKPTPTPTPVATPTPTPIATPTPTPVATPTPTPVATPTPTPVATPTPTPVATPTPLPTVTKK